jgi:hypothetical protein
MATSSAFRIWQNRERQERQTRQDKTWRLGTVAIKLADCIDRKANVGKVQWDRTNEAEFTQERVCIGQFLFIYLIIVSL